MECAVGDGCAAGCAARMGVGPHTQVRGRTHLVFVCLANLQGVTHTNIHPKTHT